MIRKISFIMTLLILTILTNSFSAPMWGETMLVKQPDGTKVEVKIFGDEYYRRIEGLDGYTLIKDKKTKWICYADLSTNGEDFISTGKKYTIKGKVNALQRSAAISHPDLKVKKGLKLNKSVLKKLIKQRREDYPQYISYSTGSSSAQRLSSAPEASSPYIGDVRGITVLIDFPDDTATVDQNEIDNMLNQTGYSNNGNVGSLKDFFFDVSEGQLTYTNAVTAYFRAPQPKTYYNEDTGNKTRVHDLLKAALLDVEANGFDFSTLSVDANGVARGLNFYYAGNPDVPWSVGLWPHASGLGTSHQLTLDGVLLRGYQMTSIGTTPTIGVFAHENGHLLLHWPDTYDYDGGSRGLSFYDLMSAGHGGNPQIPNVVFRNEAGWVTRTDISNATPGTVFSHLSNSNTCYYFPNPNDTNESFYIESRTNRPYASGNVRWNYSDQGLMIWHYDRNMWGNSREEMTPEEHYRISLEQANGEFALEDNAKPLNQTCLYRSGNATNFNDGTLPNALWWNGSPSGLQIANVSTIQPEMTFEIGDVTPSEFIIETVVRTGAEIVQLPANGNLVNGSTGVGPTGGNNFGTVPEAGDKVFANQDGSQYAVEISSASAWWLNIPWNTPYQGAGCNDCELSVIKGGSGSGAPNGVIEPTGPVSVIQNSQPLFKMVPDAGYQVKNVIVDGVSQGEIYEYQFSPVNENHIIEVEYEPATTLMYQLTVAGQNGPGTYEGRGEYLSGTTVTIKATPGPGYIFDHWMVYAGNYELTDPTQNPLDVVVNSTGTILAVYTVPTEVSLSLETSGTGIGSVSGSGIHPYDSPINITAIPDAGSRFIKWNIVEGYANIGNPSQASTTVTLYSDAVLSAEFESDQTVNLDMRIEGAGTATLTGAGTYAPGTVVNIEAAPEAGWKFKNWGVDAGGDAVIADVNSSSTSVTVNTNSSIFAVLEEDIVSNCDGIPEYVDGTVYQNGDQVINVGKKYEVKVAGWASIGGPYEPGVGWAWENAWTYIEDCQ